VPLLLLVDPVLPPVPDPPLPAELLVDELPVDELLLVEVLVDVLLLVPPLLVRRALLGEERVREVAKRFDVVVTPGRTGSGGGHQ